MKSSSAVTHSMEENFGGPNAITYIGDMLFFLTYLYKIVEWDKHVRYSTMVSS